MTIWIGFTNQKLYQARLLLGQASSCDAPVLASALRDSALLHMQFAWRSYLNEMGAATRLKSEVGSLDELVAATSLVTGEMREWQNLQADAFSWFNAFQSAANRIGWPEQASTVKEVPGQHSVNLIAVASADDAPDDLSGWWQKLSGLIDAQRQNRQES